MEPSVLQELFGVIKQLSTEVIQIRQDVVQLSEQETGNSVAIYQAILALDAKLEKPKERKSFFRRFKRRAYDPADLATVMQRFVDSAQVVADAVKASTPPPNCP